MSQRPYDKTSSVAIRDYAMRLSGKTLAEAVDMSGVLETVRNKGDLGSMVERYFFEHTPPNDHNPDFKDAGVELKVTGVIKDKTGGFKAKERLVLMMINYMTLVEESWSESSLLRKCQLMLILFYLYEKSVPVYDRRFVLDPLLWSFPEKDMRIISSDWEKIRQKIKEGKAHELSEGDTFYLAACRKGSGGVAEKERTQPFSEITAKSRAFSLKPSYMNTILKGHATESVLLEDLEDAEKGLEASTMEKFKPYLGKDVKELEVLLGRRRIGTNDKGFFRDLVMLMLGVKGKTVPEFVKADIELKAVRLQVNGKPKESMSFPTFRYDDIVEEEWEESVFYERLNRKFLFVIFQYDADDSLIFSKVKFWNMPYRDREEARRVWEKTRSQIASHKAEDLPKMRDSRVAHVRPHAANANDTYPTPQGTPMVKKCFWLNDSYIADQLR